MRNFGDFDNSGLLKFLKLRKMVGGMTFEF